ncbi:MAG: DUF4286 family protein [Bacteroidaceae bacterium]|nr:DUF4286 family protein [Bacteroidaceae bacterium]MCF0187165.1 DUF4286 family protein [Bacteroidaceae bacterium]
MLLFNTTYQVDLNDAREFVIFIHEQFLPSSLQQGDLKNGRLARILSHKEPESECFALQFEVEDSAALHRWHVKIGQQLEADIQKMFKGRAVGFSTLMEIID